MPEKNDILIEFHQLILDIMIGQGIENSQAIIIATNTIEVLQKTLGGHPIYIKKGVYQEIKNRNKTICLKFNGTNHHKLAKEFNLSSRQIYDIVRADLHKNQLSIFE